MAAASSKDDDTPSISCRSLTTACHTQQGASQRVRYIQALELSQTFDDDSYVVKHNVLLGDLVVYTTTSSANGLIAKNMTKCSDPVQIGQVVALMEAKSFGSSNSVTEYKAVVRPFFFFDQVKQDRKHNDNNNSTIPKLSDHDDKTIRKNMRYQAVIFESPTGLVETIYCHQIALARHVELVPSSITNAAKAIRPERLGLELPLQQRKNKPKLLDAWIVKFICAHRIESNGSIVAVDDWSHYSIVAPSSSLSSSLPLPLQRGLDSLGDATLVQASRRDFYSHVQPYLTTETRCTVESLHPVANDEDDGTETTRAAATTTTTTTTATQSDSRISTHETERRSSSRKPRARDETAVFDIVDDAPKQPASRKRKQSTAKASKSVTTKKAQGDNKPASKRRRQENSFGGDVRDDELPAIVRKKKEAATNKKKPAIIKKSSAALKKKAAAKREFGNDDDDDGAAESDDNGSSHGNSTVHVTPPTSGPIYSLSGKARGQANKPSLHFYTHVQLAIDRFALHKSLRKQVSPHWTVSVGDVIAVHCEEAKDSQLSGKPLHSSNKWFPFTRPWSAAQILSIYQVGSDGNNASHDMDGLFFMELRWFYRPHELEPEIKANLLPKVQKQLFGMTAEAARMMIEVDEHVTEARVESALGRVITSSDAASKAAWNQNLSNECVPQIHLLVPYAYLMQYDEKNVRATNDWDNFGAALEGPLNCALTCEKGMPGRKEGKRLRKLYKAFFMQKYKLQGVTATTNVQDDLSAVDAMTEELPGGTKAFTAWPKDLLNDKSFTCSTERAVVLHSLDVVHGKRRDFLHSIFLPVSRKKCDPRATASKVASEPLWDVRVGDFVCVMNEVASDEPDYRGRNRWYPFLGPWSVCQILCIYRDSGRRGDASLPLLEMRYFQQRQDLPEHLHSWMPPQTDFDRLPCFETDLVVADVPVSRVLGRAEIFFGRHSNSATVAARTQTAVPSRACRCSFYYDIAYKRFQPLFSASKTPAGWLALMQERGFKASTFLQTNDELRKHVLERSTFDNELFNLDPMLTDKNPEKPALFPLELPCASDVPLFVSAPVDPRWSCFAAADRVCGVDDRINLTWFARLGDIVAVTSPDLEVRDNLYPFTIPWKVGQILSIFRSADGALMTELRWLKHQRCQNADSLDIVVETAPAELGEVFTSDLLGPVTVLGDKLSRNQWATLYPFLPVVAVMYGGHEATDNGPNSSRSATTLSTITSRELALSSHYMDLDRAALLDLLDDQIKQGQGDDVVISSPAVPTIFGSPRRDNSQLPGSQKHKMTHQPALVEHSTGTTIHIDKSSGIQFFKAVDMSIQHEALPFHETSNGTWSISVGDVAIIRCDAGRRVKKEHCEPFTMPWSIGEIVTIFKRSSALRLEIRWFYRSGDIPGSALQKDETCNSILDEVFETDHYDEVCSSTLLAPVHLIDPASGSEDTVSSPASRFVFICKSFWSHKNKSIVPSGGLGGRVARGQRFSKFFVQLGALSQPEQNDSDHAGLGIDNQMSITSAFRRVIEKLSLTDASKEAIKDGDGLVGRQKERDKIGNFLRLAIVGRINDKRPSLFVAGPPGVGKTACVRAVVCDLQREQAAGDLPAFRFISMNGMEMRHPLEFYARFLEHLTGDRVSVAAKTASQRVDNFFGKTGGEPSTTVLLVDEIDYLVTRDQNVIYSLFDWPSRSAEMACPRRLVLIGISNSLNLPEQMHPRVQSRLGSHRCPFRAYSIPEAAEILRTKIAQASPRYKVFKSDCIDFAAKKTATMSGDIRKALTICRTAAESVLDDIESGKNKDTQPQVVLNHLFNVTASTFNSPQANRIACLADFEVLVVVALAWLSKSTGREQGGFDVEEVVIKMQAMTNAIGNNRYTPPLSLSETLEIFSRLGAAQLLSLFTTRNASISYRAAMAGSGGAWPLATLLVDDNTLWLSLKGGPHEALAKKFLKR